MNNAEKNSSVGEQELPSMLWETEKFLFHLYGKVVYQYIIHPALEPLIERNWRYTTYSALLVRWLCRLAHFDIWLQCKAGNNSKLTDFLSRHPTDLDTQ